MREYVWKHKCGKLQFKCTDKYEIKGGRNHFEVLGIWRKFVSVLALLLDNKKWVKFTQSGINIFKSDLKTGIIFSFLFYTQNFCYEAI